MNNPARLTAGDQGSIGGLRQSFPYFIPVRYLNAVATHRESPYSPAMLSAINPYMGNWILFSDFMDASLVLIDEENHDERGAEQTEEKQAVADIIPDTISPVTEIITSEIEHQEVGANIVSETQSIESSLETIAPFSTNNEDGRDPKELPDLATAPVEQLPSDDVVEESPTATTSVEHSLSDDVVEESSTLIEKIAIDPTTEFIENSEVIEPASIENQMPFTTEEHIPENTVNEDAQTINDVALALEEAPLSDFFVDVVTNEPIVTTTSTDTMEPEVEAINNVIIEVAETNIIDDLPDANATDLDEEHNNFWSQGDEEVSNTEQEVNTPDLVEDPIPEQLPIKKTPAPESSIQSQIPAEEFKPTQYTKQEKPLIYPIYTEDYFLQQGEKISPVLPEDIDSLKTTETAEEAAKSLMVMMSFTEWLLHFKSSTEKQKEETKDQRALKTMWQKEKLAAAIEEENEEIPENVFEMAVNSITKEDGLASESLADIYIKQGKLDKAIDMYRKLSLRNPQKNAYFARKIEEILKDK